MNTYGLYLLGTLPCLIGTYNEKICWLSFDHDVQKYLNDFPNTVRKDDPELCAKVFKNEISWSMLHITGTKFELDVLKALCTVPKGNTISYRDLAILSGYSGTCRAVGTVMRKNKIAYIIPCHRVIKSNGDIGEYQYGWQLKEQILRFESM